MSKTKKESNPQQQKKSAPSKKQWIAISIILLLVIVSVSVLSIMFLQPAPVPFSLNAAIVDQLAEDFPNPSFAQNVTKLLKDYGFNVTYQNKTDVDFFRQLAKLNCGIMILRAHSALRNDNSTVDLFTSEPFDSSKHVEDQNSGLVVNGTLNYNGVEEAYFAITSQFIERLEGNFPKSIIISMGCWSLNSTREQVAAAFQGRGAKAYIGWTYLVGGTHSDEATIQFVTRLIENKTTLEEATRDLWDTTYGSKMDVYPTSAKDLRLSDLTAETKLNTASMSRLSALNFFTVALDVADYTDRQSRTELNQSGLSSVYIVSKQSSPVGCGGHRPSNWTSVVF